MPRSWLQLPERVPLLAAVAVGLAIGIAFESVGNVVWTDYMPLPDAVMRQMGLMPRGQGRSYIHYAPETPPFPFDSSSLAAPRVHFAVAGQVHVFCYPTPPEASSRPVVALEDASPADFDFLALDRLDPPSKRLESQSDEDAFCRRLLQVGAKPWDSLLRFAAVMKLLSVHGDADRLAMMRRDRLDPPPPAETAWTSACVDEQGRLWMAKLERTISGLESRGDERTRALLGQRARLRLAATMPEKCWILQRHFHATMYENLDEASM